MHKNLQQMMVWQLPVNCTYLSGAPAAPTLGRQRKIQRLYILPTKTTFTESMLLCATPHTCQVSSDTQVSKLTTPQHHTGASNQTYQRCTLLGWSQNGASFVVLNFLLLEADTDVCKHAVLHVELVALLPCFGHLVPCRGASFSWVPRWVSCCRSSPKTQSVYKHGGTGRVHDD